METYHRKRSKNAIKASSEMMNVKRQQQSTTSTTASLPPMAGQDDETPDQLIEVGSVYEIDHTYLPPRTPVQLRFIRVVMVSEKTELNVSVRFPSNESLRTYFSDSIREMYPALDDKFVMGTKLAGKVLYRQVPSHEFAEKKHSESFWLVTQSSLIGGSGDVTTKKDMGLTTELKSNGMVRWGVRRQVLFLAKHSDNGNPDQSSSSFVKGVGDTKEKGVIKFQVEDDDNYEDEKEEQEEEVEEEEEEDAEKVDEETHEFSLKRKRYSFRSVQKAKKVKHEKQRQVHKAKKTKNNRCKQIVLRDPTDRWSKERYKLAEKNLLEVMKEKGAVIGNPILRPALRAEARKRIGDTGLLDHLLKHMAGKVAPGGVERFRRRHNAAGAMEYWLESADLVKIRTEAGVEDPFWTPPPGWKPGDCPTQDPICAKELKLLKEQTSNIKGNMEEMVSKKKFEEELAKLRREMEGLASKEKPEEAQAIMVSEDPPGVICPKFNLGTSFVPPESEPDNAVPLGKYKEQLMDISDFLKKIEVWVDGEMVKVKALMEGKTKSGAELIVSRTATESCAEKEKKREAAEKSQEVIYYLKEDEEEGELGSEKNTKRSSAAVQQPEKAAAAEEKAAKIQRLKSGFRICKPQGTFLWPNMVKKPTSDPATSQVVVQVEDLCVVPTPPSVSSSTASAGPPPQLPCVHHHHHPASPVKPLAERRAVTVTVSTVSKGPKSYEDGDHNNYSTTTTTLINLNDIPTGLPGEGFYGNPSSQKTVTTTTVMPSLMPSTRVKREMAMSSPWEVYGNGGGCGGNKINGEPNRNMMKYSGHQDQESQQGRRSSSSSSASSASCLSKNGAITWLALATPDSAPSDDSSRG